MTSSPAEALAELTARIGTPSPSPGTMPPGITGQLADLRGWWERVTPEGALRVSHLLSAPTDDNDDALQQGITEGDRAIDAGATLLVPRAGSRRDRTARAIIGLLTRKEASAVLGQPEGMSDLTWMLEVGAIRDLMADHRDVIADQLALLAALQARDIAYVAGVLLAAAARSTPCLIDGTDEWAAALVADRLAHRARGWWRSACTSTDPARIAARDRIDIEPGLPLGLSDEEGTGAEATIALLGIALAQ